MYIKNGLILSFLLLLAACQTTNIQSVEADKYRMLISQFCVVRMMADASQIGGDQKINDITIYKIDKNSENWERVSYASTGIRDNFYLNLKKQKIFCSTFNWRKEFPNVTF